MFTLCVRYRTHFTPCLIVTKMRLLGGLFLQCVGLLFLCVEIYGQTVDCKDNAAWCPTYSHLCGQDYVKNLCLITCRTSGCGSSTASWGDWGRWSNCPVTCGGGTQTRSRTCGIPGQCSGSSVETKKCNEQQCPSNVACRDQSTACSQPWVLLSCGQILIAQYCPLTCRLCTPSSSGGAKWSDWSVWDDCSASCDSGTQSRTRTCSETGKCSGSASESRACNEQACEVPKWSSWSNWGSCPKTCGIGKQTRTRTCSISGQCSVGNPSESRACNTPPCAVKEYSNWSSYGRCSVNCGGGIHSRTRRCLTGSCDKHLEEIKNCNMRKCSGSTNCRDGSITCTEPWAILRCSERSVRNFCKLSCGVCVPNTGGGEWSVYGPCSPACGVGKKTRTKGNIEQSITCINEECGGVGEWSNWSAYSACSAACGLGTQERTRTCSIPGTCPGSGEQTQSCEIKLCEGSWGEWSQWPQCPVSCGGADIERTRPCNGPGQCTGNAKDTKKCNTQACDGSWGDWSRWSQCSVSCGGSDIQRTRPCNGPGQCSGDATQTRKCNTQSCPSWSDWSAWKKCSVTCGKGQQERTRSCNVVGQCTGNNNRETRPCEFPSCPDYSNWSNYGPCSDNCGGGVQSRTRRCNIQSCSGHLEEIRNCNTQQCPPTSGPEWSAYGPCSVRCGVGIKTRTKGSLSQSITCIITGCDPNAGYWSDWSSYGACTEACSHARTRVCSKPPTCPGPGRETKSCTDPPCKGVWGNWSPWTKCKVTCGGGQEERTRTCGGPGQCVGNPKETRQCNTQICPGVWGNWSPWTKCKVTCGGGQEERTRTCGGPGQCVGNPKETRQCNTQICPGVWGNWSPWTKCKVTCGGGQEERTRTCGGPGQCVGNPKETRQCNTQICPGVWGNWSPWTKCKVTCGGGQEERTRTCGGPGQCVGNPKETRQCNTQICPGVWGNWSPWTKCKVTCGGGQEERTRTCGGPGQCVGNPKETRQCNTQICPGSWGTWTAFSACTAECGGGEKTRTRLCEGGNNCVGETEQTVVCNPDDCKTGWLPWEKWGGCDKPCGPGNRKRLRICVATGGCQGSSEQTEQCTLRDNCNEDAVFSTCSQPCGDGIQKKLGSSGQYSTQHCKIKDCPDASCPFGQETRFKDLASCCNTVSNTAPICHRAGQSLQSNRRIIGGEDSKKGDWPWMVYFQSQYGVCGGSIISDKFILTAAHCLQSDSGFKYPASAFTVVIGITNLNNWDNTAHPLKQTIVHPNYDFPTHDIGLLELATPISQFTQYIRPICLPHGEEIPNDATCIAMGWGVSDNDNRQVTRILQNVDLNVFDPDVCIHGYTVTSGLQSFVPFLKRNKGYICAGSYNSTKDSCSGDSGSPLACQRCDSCSWFAAGIVSYGPQPCAIIGAPGIYTKVTEYEQWIYHATGIPKEVLSCSG